MNLNKLQQKTIPLVFATDNNYFPYMAVSIQSVMENADPEQNFSIYVLCQTLSDDYKYLLQKNILVFQNFSITYIDVTDYFINYSDLNISKYTITALFRLLIPDIFRENKYVLWMDVDTICRSNIADLYDKIDENCMLKCVKDIGTLSLLRRHPKKIGLNRYHKYFSTGVLVFNIELFRKQVTFKQMMQLCEEKKFPYPDQDLLNILCENNVQYTSMDWNVMCCNCRAYQNPKIIHYVWDKPWKSFYKTKRGDYFWNYAKKTNFYDIIVNKSKKKNLKDGITLMKYWIITIFAKIMIKNVN